MATAVSVVVYLLCAITTIFIAAVVIIDMVTRVDYLKTKVPWLAWTERQKWQGPLLLVCAGLLIGIGYEFAIKEVPEVSAPAAPRFPAPLAPALERIKPVELPAKIIFRDRPVPMNPSDEEQLRRLKTEVEKSAKLQEQRDKIALFMREGLQIKQDCLTTLVKPDLITRSDQWGKDVYHYLLTVDKSYAVRFDGATGVTYTHESVPKLNEDVWNRINLRYLVLEEITKELR